MEIVSICILIAPADANCFVKKATSNAMRKKENVSKLSSYKNKRQSPTAAVKFLYAEDNGTNLIYYHLGWAFGRNTWEILMSPGKDKWEGRMGCKGWDRASSHVEEFGALQQFYRSS